jgi:hypothetical protein
MRIEWVELDPTRNWVVRIFKTTKASLKSTGPVELLSYAEAVSSVRHQLWLRSRGQCELCAVPVSEQGGNMHEKRHRGKGGEISLDNSVFICRVCHMHAHANRAPRWSKKT